MKELRSRYLLLMSDQLDVSEHMGLLHGLACDPDVHTIVEIGFRKGVSATALALAGKTFYSYDIDDCRPAVAVMKSLAPNFQFMRANSLEVKIPACELLFIDGEHTYRQVLAELRLHSPSVGKWIALHDTETFGTIGRDRNAPGLKAAIDEFLKENNEWKLLLHLTHNNGLTVLERSTTH